jgi:hypothetical protein
MSLPRDQTSDIEFPDEGNTNVTFQIVPAFWSNYVCLIWEGRGVLVCSRTLCSVHQTGHPKDTRMSVVPSLIISHIFHI